MKKAFTIVELLVAMTIIVILLAGSGYVFHTAVQAERTARATAEIARKIRGITSQLNIDFKGLRKDSVIISSWTPIAPPPGGTEYQRVDQIMFFANGNFNTYNNNPKNIEGGLARIQYAIARPGPDSEIPVDIDTGVPLNPADRILARVQHVNSPDDALPMFPDLSSFDLDDFIYNEKVLEYDTLTLRQWNKGDNDIREEMFKAITAIDVDLDGNGTVGSTPVGVVLDKNNPDDLHKLFCEGVGEFIIQDWRWVDYEVLRPSYPNPPEWRWWPEIDPDGDGDYKDSDFNSSASDVIDLPQNLWVYYPGDGVLSNYYGRAFKFTFTLYDSYGIFPEGKTFSHIIYLD